MGKNVADVQMFEQKEDKLCERGFFIINRDTNVILPDYIKSWDKTDILNFSFYLHPKQTLYFKLINNEAYFIIGHAYNPFTNTISENVILEEWSNSEKSTKGYSFDYINSITGIFILGKISENKISVVLDCSGMMGGYYGIVGDDVLISSHTVVFAELFGLEPTSYVKKLLSYKFYSLYGSYLPGDITPYENVYRITPNTEVIIDISTSNIVINRFYPDRNIEKITNEDDYKKQIEKIAEIFQKSMFLIAQKWSSPAISLTGGMDSKTTLAAAAENICKAIGVNHITYNISPNPEHYSNFILTKNILQHNKDYIGKSNTNDICKRDFFSNINDFDVEVKSWVSEIARANYYKKFGKKKMPKNITPRRCSSMYKIFLHNRKLLKETDNVFSNYINKTQLKDKIYNLDWSDLFLWEIRYGSWGGLVITSEHKYSFDITIPYNNRRLLEMMLAVPLEKRRKDILHNDLIKHMNSKIFDTGINIVNLNETKFREICEKIYFNINTFLPF